MDRIIKTLDAFPEISAWRVKKVNTTRYQMFVIGSSLDTIRKVVTESYQLTVYCDHADLRGATDLVVYEHELDRLEQKLRKAVFIARRVGARRFELPSPSHLPFVEAFDPTLLGDVQDILFVKLADRLIEAVAQQPSVTLSSSEYFLDVIHTRLINSRGIDATMGSTEIFFDGILLSESDGRRVEVHFEPRARRLQDLPVEEIVRQYAGYARDSLRAGLPASGTQPVIICGDALTHIFSTLIHHTSAASHYRQISSFRRGHSIYPGGRPQGEPLTLISNAFVPFGLRTAPCDGDGVAGQRVELIREGRFERPWSTKQYADYLEQAPTGSVANLEIPVGRNPLEALRRDGPNLEVAAFSAMMPDPVSGDFAAEIKLGYEHRGGISRPVKGGSISGNILTGFQHAYFSTEGRFGNYGLTIDQFGSYIGPAAIRFEGFQVSGG
ncbi:hypothetical protein JW905_00790 [bacterium]|nr:hypothetical protein [candidate division CSSED10-310 bacterium]